MRKRKFTWMSLLFLLFFFISACSKADEPLLNEENTTKAQIVTSIFPVYEIVREVAGDQADVHLMVGASEDAHHYEPSAKAIMRVNEADAFIYSSDEMEFWVSDMLAVVENEGLHTIELSENIDLEIASEEKLDDHEEEESHEGHDHGNIDPHIWLNPMAMAEQIPMLTDLLSEIDPAGATAYQENGQRLTKDLEDLDISFQESFAGAKNRAFVVQHKAFGHLAERYNLTQLSVGGLSTEVEPNPKDLIKVIQFVEANDTEVIFYQSGNTSAVAETIATETGAEIAVLYDLENKPEGIDETGNMYLKAMSHNLEQLKKVIK